MKGTDRNEGVRMAIPSASVVAERAAGNDEPVLTGQGRAPGGMWWVAGRQHRLVVMISVGVLTLLTLSMLVFRLRYNAAVPIDAATCRSLTTTKSDAYRCQSVWDTISAYQSAWSYLRLPLLGLPVLLGGIAGGALISQERDRGTHIFALTQSVSRTRWYSTKCVTVAVPLVIAQSVAGLVAGWAGSAPGLEGASKLDIPYFQITGLVPAALLLLSFGVAVAVGVFIRSTLPAVTAGLTLAALAVIALGYVAYPNLVPHSRIAAPVGQGVYPVAPQGSFEVSHGYAGSAGHAIALTGCPGLERSQIPGVERTSNAPSNDCLQNQGITQQFVIYIDPARITQLIATLWAAAAAAASASIGIGLWRIRRQDI